MEPHQSSARWGTDYESWEWDGSVAGLAADRCAALDGRPSRVDIAFDFEVHPDVIPDMVSDLIKGPDITTKDGDRHQASKGGFSLGVAGQGGVNTVYVGSPRSDRRIRIYRKDRRDLFFRLQEGPTLRVEVELHKEQAHAFWQEFQRDSQHATRVAAAHVEQMFGVRCMPSVTDLPEIVRPEGISEAESLFKRFEQHSGWIMAADEAGLDVVRIAQEFTEGASRMTEYRRRKLAKSLQAIGPEMLRRMLRSMLEGKRKLMRASEVPIG
jgi:hypothetical protein